MCAQINLVEALILFFLHIPQKSNSFYHSMYKMGKKDMFFKNALV